MQAKHSMAQNTQALGRAAKTAAGGTAPRIQARNPVVLTADGLPKSFIFTNHTLLKPIGSVPRNNIYPNRFLPDKNET